MQGHRADSQGPGAFRLHIFRVTPYLEPAREWHATDMHGLCRVTVVLLNIYLCGLNPLFLTSQVTEPAIRTYHHQVGRVSVVPPVYWGCM